MESASTPRILNGRYRLDRELGAGGMGIVYRAFDLLIERPVAVKILRGEMAQSRDDSARFMREVRATALVKNRHSVTIFDVGETPEGDPFLVMSLLEGESLHQVLQREGKLSPLRAVDIALQAAEALAAAHAVAIVHRDVKPANIMLTSEEGRDFVTVLDFGIAKRIDSATAIKLTATGTMVGTLEYMAPEQIADERIDGRADQYALAATLIRMISGEALFVGVSVATIVHHQLLTMPKSLTARGVAAPTALDAVLLRALAKKPADRYSDIGAFANALRAAVDLRPSGSSAASGALGASAHFPASAPSEVDRTRLDSPSSHHSPKLSFELDGTEEHFELAEERESKHPRGPMTIAVNVPLVVPEPAPLLAESRSDSLARVLLPGLWKRVAAYSALALLLGNACIAGFSTTSSVVLVLGIMLGAGALFANQVRERRK